MKTPLKELIEIIKKRQEDDEAMPFMYNDRIIALAESLLEKEKEAIMDAYNYGQQIPPFDYAERYYNETLITNVCKCGKPQGGGWSCLRTDCNQNPK